MRDIRLSAAIAATASSDLWSLSHRELDGLALSASRYALAATSINAYPLLSGLTDLVWAWVLVALRSKILAGGMDV